MNDRGASNGGPGHPNHAPCGAERMGCPNTRPASVLIVDDESANIQTLGSVLSRDYRVRAATDGVTAISIASSEDPPDLILLDVVMPLMDGYEVCAKLKSDSRTSNIPIVFVTSRDHVQDEARGLDLGAADYVNKPVDPLILQARVRTQLRLKRRTDLLASLACIDPLTELPNRRGLEEHLDREWRRAIRERTAISALMIDVDEFKRYNDHYGHGAGDRCLQAVARAMHAALRRPGDMVARYGGEEFSVVLPGTDLAGAQRVANDMRARVEALGIEHERSTSGRVVTVSIGGATMIPGANAQSKVLMRNADQFLYGAKAQGRNRVVAADLDGRNGDCSARGGSWNPIEPFVGAVP